MSGWGMRSKGGRRWGRGQGEIARMSLCHASPSPYSWRHCAHPAWGDKQRLTQDSEVVCLPFCSLEPPQLESNKWPLRKLPPRPQQPLSLITPTPVASSHDHSWVGIEGRRPRMRPGKILEGRREGVLIKLCLFIHGPGSFPPF